MVGGILEHVWYVVRTGFGEANKRAVALQGWNADRIRRVEAEGLELSNAVWTIGQASSGAQCEVRSKQTEVDVQ